MLALIILASSFAVIPPTEARQAVTPNTTTEKRAVEIPKAPPREAALWLEDAKVLTAEIIADDASLENYNDYVLQARLAQAWWKADPRKAGDYLANAMSVGRGRLSESPLEAMQRLQVGVTVQIVTPLDQKGADELLDAILEQAAKVGPLAKTEEEKKHKSWLGSRLSQLDFDRSNVTRQAKVVRALMGIDSAFYAIPPLLSIYGSNKTLGDELYGQTLDAVANHSLSVGSLGLLPQLSFPMGSASDRIKVSPQLTERMLMMTREAILEAATNGLTEESCHGPLDLNPVLPHFPPDTQAELSHVLQQCASIVGIASSSKKSDTPTRKLETAQDYLEAAENETSIKRRASYKRRAISLLEEKNPEKALEVLDGLSSEEQANIPDLDNKRDMLESSVAEARFKVKDYSGLQRLIDRAPFPARTALRIASASRDNPEYASTLLPVIVDHLADGKIADSAFYLLALRYVAKNARPLLPIAFRDALKGLNQTTEFIPGQTEFPKGTTFLMNSFWWNLEPAMLGPMFDVLDPRVTRLTIESLRYPMARASFRLWLLKGELQEYENAMKEGLKPKPETEKKPAATP